MISDKGNEMNLISIVIPVYNAEKYIEQCVKSVLAQTFKEFELILINDGSTDNSMEILNRLMKIDNRIRVIDKKNGGVSSARNKGICEAKGKYIMFIDADDYVRNDMLELLYNSSEKIGADIAFCGFEVQGSTLIFNDTDALIELSKRGNNVSKENMLKKIISTDEKRVCGYIWRNLFRLDLLKENNILFPENIKISEDYMFLLVVLKYAGSITIIPDELYFYRINDTSVTAKYMPTLHDDMAEINEWMLKNICEFYPQTFNGYYCCVANTYLRFVQNVCRKGNPYSFLERIKNVYQVKKKYNYRIILKKALSSGKPLSKKNILSYCMLLWNMEIVYMFLFRLKLRKKDIQRRIK